VIIYYVGRTPELTLNINHEMTMLSPECMAHIDSCCYTLSKQNWVGGKNGVLHGDKYKYFYEC